MAEKTPESKLIKALRIILSFILSVVIATIGVAVCVNSSFLDGKNIEKHFTSYEYVSGVREDVISYTESVYDRNGLDKSNIYDIITFEKVSEAVQNYTGHYISSRIGFDEDTYTNTIDGIVDVLSDDIDVQVKKSGQAYDAESAKRLTDSVNSYFVSAVDITGVSYIETILNVGVPISYAVIGIGVFFFIFITLILYFLGERRYRSLRAISISFWTSGIFEICLAVMVFVISRVKKFDVYPIYLSEQLMKYVDGCLGMVAVLGLMLIVVAISTSAAAWLSKRNKS